MGRNEHRKKDRKERNASRDGESRTKQVLACTGGREKGTREGRDELGRVDLRASFISSRINERIQVRRAGYFLPCGMCVCFDQTGNTGDSAISGDYPGLFVEIPDRRRAELKELAFASYYGVSSVDR